MPKTVILGTARTPIGKMGGSLSSLDATELGGLAIKAALERADVGGEQVQHVVMGQVLQAGQGQIPSRQAQIKAGIPKEVTSETVNKVCASGVRAAGIIDTAIRAGDLEVAVGGGMESMSGAPYLLPDARFGYRMGDAKALDAMVHDGLTNPFSGRQMFDEATEIGDELELTRPDLDRWALRSHERAIEATDDGRLPEEIVPVTISSRKGDTVVEVDEAPRRGSSAGVAGQAARPDRQGGLAHGLELAGRQRRRRRAGARVRRVGAGQRQGDPRRDRRAGADRRRLRLPGPHAGRAGEEGAREGRACSPSDIDLWEINEAFASLGLLPVVRRQDVDVDVTAGEAVNTGTFAVANRALAAGALVAVFPEGTAHDEPGLLPLRTGAARLALGARAEGARRLAVVPLGIVFEDKLALRSRALVVVGEPLELDDWVTAYGEPTTDDTDRRAVIELTGELSRRLGALLPGFRDADEAVLLGRAVDVSLRVDGEARASLARRTALARRLAAAEAGSTAAVLDASRRYQELLGTQGWQDADAVAVLDGGPAGPSRTPRRSGRAVAGAMALAPAAVAGAVVHLAPYLAVRAAGGLAHKPAGRGTYRVLAALVTFPLAWVGAGVAVGRRWGWAWGVAAAMVTPVVGYATVLELEQVATVPAVRRGGGDRLTVGERAELAAARQAVVDAVQAAGRHGVR